MKVRQLALILAGLGACTSSHAEHVEWANGRWYTGESFEQKTVYTSGGVITSERPRSIDRVVDLGGQYVMPAFGDAHHHGFDRAEGFAEKRKAFVGAGIFYVKNPNVIPKFLDESLREQINRPGSIDVAFANGGLTATGGHPGPLHDRLASNGVFPGLRPEDMEGQAYWTLDARDDVGSLWPRILRGRPDFIKVFLNGARADAPHGRGDGEEGLSQEVLQEVVSRAHSAGLRVTAHVDTASDFSRALDAGVDEMGHLPLPDPSDVRDGDYQPFFLSPEMAKRAAAARVVVVATTNVVPRFRGASWSKSDWENVLRVHRSNLSLLAAHGVMLAIGSDGISGEHPLVTARDEVAFLAAHKLLENTQIMRAWAEVTPQTIFPKRRIGRLATGYEANFVTLAGNPLVDLSYVDQIVMRIKQGQVIEP